MIGDLVELAFYYYLYVKPKILGFKSPQPRQAPRQNGVFGNNERNQVITTLNKKLAEIKFIKENPYFIDDNNDYSGEYLINGEIVITSTAFENEFTSNIVKFNYDNLKEKKQVYDIQFSVVKKDTVGVLLIDYYDSGKNNLKFKILKKNSKWDIDTNN